MKILEISWTDLLIKYLLLNYMMSSTLSALSLKPSFYHYLDDLV